MIALDTNVLVRFLVRDDEVQASRVLARLRSVTEQDGTAFVPDVVLAELVWVLRSTYRFPKDRIVSVVRGLYATRHLTFSSPDRITRALSAFETGRGDFADYLIREQARDHGCGCVVTFDRKVNGEKGFEEP